MHARALLSAMTIASLVSAGCSDDTKEQSPGEVLARDSSLASGLQRADTSAAAKAGDAATAFGTDSPRHPAIARPQASGRAPMRPAPATIHADPIPQRILPPASARPSVSPPGRTPSAGAAAILERVPGATLPPPKARP